MGDPEEKGEQFAVPEEYQNEGWTKDLKTYTDLWTKTAGAESLIGKASKGKVDLLKDNATTEEVDSFYKAIGRPDKAEGYAFDRTKQSEALKKFNSDEIDSAVKNIFHKHGLTLSQAKGVQMDYEALMESKYTGSLKDEEQLDKEFDDLTNKTFGNDKDAIIESSKILLEKFTPEGFGEHVTNLDNKSLTVLTSVLNNIKKTYINEDAFNVLKGGGGGNDGTTEEELRAQARKLMETEAWTNGMHKDHQERDDEVKAVYKKIGELG